ncbi:MAG: methyltransferase domain-containing protein [Anaerolineae bacterium]|nr:methyltransferase domain-containing protein [Anaerolineae bacterium]
MTASDTPPVCDYEGSDYRTRFWEGQGRSYEDQVERIALRRLMPPTGTTLLEVGAGFGRLADEYLGYERVVLFDYSRSLLQEAQARLGDDPRFIYVAGNWYQMPFVAGLFATLVQIRTIHHAADVPSLLQQLARIARPQGHYILEFANKQNLKAMLRYLLRRQTWSPFSPEPVEFAPLNFDFHPRWLRQQLAQAGFHPGPMLTVSHYRIPLLKKVVPTSILVKMDSLAQKSGRLWQLSPSVFIHSQHPVGGAAASPDTFFACPECQTPLGAVEAEQLSCLGCGRKYTVQNGLYDFKEPADH